MGKVRAIFPSEKHDEAAAILQTQCGNNLPLGTETPESLERVRFAALKLSAARMDKLRDAVALANKDWRDLLVAAGFAESVDAHKHWKPATLMAVGGPRMNCQH